MTARMKDYVSKIYELRYFIWHLVKLDLRNKFRRSKLGMIWTFLSPLCLTLIMSVVFSVVFHYNIATYAPYVLSGILFWDVLSSAFQAGAYVIISKDTDFDGIIRFWNASGRGEFSRPQAIRVTELAIVQNQTPVQNGGQNGNGGQSEKTSSRNRRTSSRRKSVKAAVVQEEKPAAVRTPEPETVKKPEPEPERKPGQSHKHAAHRTY